MEESLTLVQGIFVVLTLWLFISLIAYYFDFDLIAILFLSCITLPLSIFFTVLINFQILEHNREYELVSEKLNVDTSEIIYEDRLWYTSTGAYKVEFDYDSGFRFVPESISKIVKTGEILK